MTIPLLSAVHLRGDRAKEEGLPAGAIGFVVEIYGDEAYEVEFSDTAGTTIALVTVAQDDVEVVAEPGVVGTVHRAG